MPHIAVTVTLQSTRTYIAQPRSTLTLFPAPFYSTRLGR